MSKRAATVSLMEPSSKRSATDSAGLSAEDEELINKYTAEGWLPAIDNNRYTITNKDLETVRKMDEMLRNFDAFRENSYQFNTSEAPKTDGDFWYNRLNPETTVLVKCSVDTEREGSKINIIDRRTYDNARQKSMFSSKAIPFKIELPPMIMTRAPGNASVAAAKNDYSAEIKNYHKWKRSACIPVDHSIPQVPHEFLYGHVCKALQDDGSMIITEITPKAWAYTMRLIAYTAMKGMRLLYERCMWFVYGFTEEVMDFNAYLVTKQKYCPFKTHGDGMETSIFPQFNAFQEMSMSEITAFVGPVTEAERKEFEALDAREQLLSIARKRDPSHVSLAYEPMQDEQTRNRTFRNYGYKPNSYKVLRRVQGGWIPTTETLEDYSVVKVKLSGIFYVYKKNGQVGAHFNLGGNNNIALLHSPAPSSLVRFAEDVDDEDVQYEPITTITKAPDSDAKAKEEEPPGTLAMEDDNEDMAFDDDYFE